MSRSTWACVESCGPVSAVACSSDERARLEDRARLGRGPLAGAVSSTKRLIGLMAASMLVMAAAPTAGLAVSTSGLGPKPCANKSKQSSVHGHAGAEVLTRGSGYSSRQDAVRVRVLQRRLTCAGYPPGPIDGRYGPLTQQAVTRFQATHGLLVDGIAGPLTLAALSSSSTVLYPGAGYAGHGSGAVRALQGRLKRAGYPPGQIDGRYGPRTQQAVTRFQATHGLVVDGIAGPQTDARLASEREPHKAARPSRPNHPRQRTSRHARGGRSHPRTHAAPRRVVSPTRSTSSPSSLAPVVLLVALIAVGLCAIWLAFRRRNKPYVEAQTERDGPDRANATHPKANHTITTNETPATPTETRATGEQIIATGEQITETGDQITETGDQITETPNRHLTRPERAERAFSEGLVLEEQGDLAAAAAIYGHADQLGHGGAACNLGVLLADQGDWAAAEACFRRAGQRGDAHGAFNLAVFLEEHGDRIEALSAYDRAAQLGDPETAESARAAADDLRRRVERPTAAREGGDPQ